MKPAIEVNGVSKLYRLAHQGGPTGSFREALSDALRSPWRRFRQLNGSDQALEEFWALREVDFKVMPGEVVGIIGRNGAGKSTLLKILSRIVEPTEGRVVMRGRVASLLEVGTGFHPELSGRENIFLNGSILGMKKREIAQKFDEIVAFAEIERFLDTPVKRYSSGMYVRLAFAVAAHLEPEILIVDEVLAVGDAAFRNKCLGRIKEVTASGERTVLFVSHDMAAVRSLCTSSVLLQHGKVAAIGSVDDVVLQYLSVPKGDSRARWRSSHGLELVSAEVRSDQAEGSVSEVFFDAPMTLQFAVRSERPFTSTGLVVSIYDDMGALVSSLCSVEEGIDPFTLDDEVSFEFLISQTRLYPGKYSVNLRVHKPNDGTPYLVADDVLQFEVIPSALGDSAAAYSRQHGIFRLATGCRAHRVAIRVGSDRAIDITA